MRWAFGILIALGVCCLPVHGQIAPMGGITSVAAGGTCPAPTFSPSSGYTASFTLSAACTTICYSTSTITVLVAGTCPVGSTTYTTAVSPTPLQTYYAVATQVAMTASSNATASYLAFSYTALGTTVSACTSSPCTLSITPASNTLLLVGCTAPYGQTPFAATWNSISMNADATNSGSGGTSSNSLIIYSLYVTSGTTANVSFTYGGTGNVRCVAAGVGGPPSSGYLNKTHVANANSSGPPSSGATATTSQANEFLWGVIYCSAGALSSWSNSFTASQTAGGLSEGYRIVSSTGTYTAAVSGTCAGTQFWNASIATYE